MTHQSPSSLPKKAQTGRPENPFREHIRPEQEHDEYFTTRPRRKTYSSKLETGYTKKRPLTRVKTLNMAFAYFLSLVVHALTPVIVLLLMFVLIFWFHLALPNPFAHFEKKAPRQDIEFILVPPDTVEKPPLNPDTKYLAEKQMQAGGKYDPTRPVNLTPQSAPPSSPSPPSPPPQPSMKPRPAQKPTPTVQAPPLPKKSPTEKKPTPEPVKKAVAQTPKPPIPEKVQADTPPVPEPTREAEEIAKSPPEPSKPPVSAAAESKAASGNNSASPAVPPGPLFDMSSLPNAGPGGNKNAPMGVDAKKEPDFGPYMKDLQRRIKNTWDPPRGNESKKIVVVFRVDREGKLVKHKITKSSGVEKADRAALLAIERTFPFRPLPPEYDKDTIDIEFTFDYNVFGKKDSLGRP